MRVANHICTTIPLARTNILPNVTHTMTFEEIKKNMDKKADLPDRKRQAPEHLFSQNHHQIHGISTIFNYDIDNKLMEHKLNKKQNKIINK